MGIKVYLFTGKLITLKTEIYAFLIATKGNFTIGINTLPIPAATTISLSKIIKKLFKRRIMFHL